MSVLLSVALLPVAALLYTVYRMDKIEKEPTRMLIKLFLLGCLCAVPAILLEQLGTVLLMSVSDPGMYAFLNAFVVIALAEEGCKYVFLRTTWKNPAFNYQFDAIVYAVTVSLGFAALENILYVSQFGLRTGILRAFTSVPGHCFFGVYMGFFFGRAKQAHLLQTPDAERKNRFLSLLIPTALHGTYDYFCLTDGSWSQILIFYAFLAVFFFSAVRCVKAASRDDHPVDQETFFRQGRMVVRTDPKTGRTYYTWPTVPNGTDSGNNNHSDTKRGNHPYDW